MVRCRREFDQLVGADDTYHVMCMVSGNYRLFDQLQDAFIESLSYVFSGRQLSSLLSDGSSSGWRALRDAGRLRLWTFLVPVLHTFLHTRACV